MKVRRVLRESNEALKEGYGFDNQGEDCLKFERKYGHEMVKEHRLVETSSSWNREKFHRIIDDAIQERDEIPAIEFSRVDRFARNLEAAGYYLGLLRQKGLTVMFAQEGLVVDSETSLMNVLMFFVHSFKADQDGRQIKHNLLEGRDKLAKLAHEVPNGMVTYPFDYLPKRIYGQMTTGKPTINELRAAWVKKWADWVLKDGLGLADICFLMNKEGVPPPRASKGYSKPAAEWKLKAVRDILRSRQLIGEFWWKGKCYLKDEELRIISDEQFDEIQARLTQNQERRAYNAVKYDYPPLRKMVYHHCGAMMYSKPSNGKPCYYCPKCSKSYIDAQNLWERIRIGIRERLLREERLIPALKKQLDRGDTFTNLEKEILSKHTEIEKWENAKDAAFRMGMTLTNYPKERVQEHIDEAERQIQHLDQQKVDLNKRLAVIKERTLNEEGIRRLCRLISDNINNLSKKRWQLLLQMLKLKIVVKNRELANVKVALPPLINEEIQFSHL